MSTFLPINQVQQSQTTYGRVRVCVYPLLTLCLLGTLFSSRCEAATSLYENCNDVRKSLPAAYPSQKAEPTYDIPDKTQQELVYSDPIDAITITHKDQNPGTRPLIPPMRKKYRAPQPPADRIASGARPKRPAPLPPVRRQTDPLPPLPVERPLNTPAAPATTKIWTREPQSTWKKPDLLSLEEAQKRQAEGALGYPPLPEFEDSSNTIYSPSNQQKDQTSFTPINQDSPRRSSLKKGVKNFLKTLKHDILFEWGRVSFWWKYGVWA